MNLLAGIFKLLSKGIWWKRVEKLPSGEGVLIPGNPKAWGKIVPFVWRFTNEWIVIEVDNVRPYWLFYEAGSEKRKYHNALFTRYIALRVSRGDVRFIAIGTVKSADRRLHLLSDEERQELEMAEDQIEYQITYV